MIVALPRGPSGRVLAAMLALMLLAGVWLAIANPLIGWYSSRQQALSQRAALLQRQIALVAQLPDIEREAERMRSRAPSGNAFLTGDTDAIAGANLEQLMQTMTRRSGATLTSAETLGAEAAGPYRRIKLRVSVTGDWNALITLLQAATTGQPTMLVDDLQVTATQSAQSAAPPIQASFTAIAFRNETVHPETMLSGTSSTSAP